MAVWPLAAAKCKGVAPLRPIIVRSPPAAVPWVAAEGAVEDDEEATLERPGPVTEPGEGRPRLGVFLRFNLEGK
jgi:hypothetical protein